MQHQLRSNPRRASCFVCRSNIAVFGMANLVFMIFNSILLLFSDFRGLFGKSISSSLSSSSSRIRKPPAFTTTAKKCSDYILDAAIPNDVFKSQTSEDKKLMTWFGNLCDGSYIEMGALDGVRFSNSYAFNSARQWQGVLIEIMTSNYEKLIVNRPNEIATIHAGVCDSTTKLHYYDMEGGEEGAVGGIYEFASRSFRKQWWDGISLDDPRIQEIQCDTLHNLLKEHAPHHTYFDFYSLDVEGAELAVLNSIDFDKVGFGVLFVEADRHNQLKNLAVRQLLEKKGYIFLEEWERSYWFVNKWFDEIYKDLIY